MGLSPSGFCRFEFVFFFLEYFLKLHNLHKIGFFIFCSFSKARKLEQESWKIYIFVFFSLQISVWLVLLIAIIVFFGRLAPITYLVIAKNIDNVNHTATGSSAEGEKAKNPDEKQPMI